MREQLDTGDFVIAAYAISILGIAALLIVSWLEMRRAEQRREGVRRR